MERRIQSNKTKHVESRLDKMNGLIWELDKVFVITLTLNCFNLSNSVINNTINRFSSFHNTLNLLCPNHQTHSHDCLVYNLAI